MNATIGEAARRSSCPASTIRYYERIGLLRAPDRGINGYRYYDSAAIERLSFVHHARTLGFSVDAVTNLLRLADHPNNPCDDIDQLLAGQITATRTRIDQLLELESELKTLQAACDGGHNVSDCGILSLLSDG